MTTDSKECYECFLNFSKNDLIDIKGRFVCISCKQKHLQKLHQGFDFSLQDKIGRIDNQHQDYLNIKPKPLNKYLIGFLINIVCFAMFLVLGFFAIQIGLQPRAFLVTFLSFYIIGLTYFYYKQYHKIAHMMVIMMIIEMTFCCVPSIA